MPAAFAKDSSQKPPHAVTRDKILIRPDHKLGMSGLMV